MTGRTPNNPPRLRRTILAAAIVALILLAVVSAYFIADFYSGIPADAVATFVGRDSCIVCHQDQAQLFNGSHHDLAMDVANEQTVLGKFDGSVIEHFGTKSRVFRDGQKFMVETDGADGKLQQFEVKYVFGVSPLQQYMVELAPPRDAKEPGVGRIQVLRESWDAINQRWFYLSPPDVNAHLEPGDPLHWTGFTQSWNTSCAECHSTNLQKNFDVLTATFQTTFSEIDVSCEACHGPGSLHVQLAESSSPFWDRNRGYGLNKLKTAENIAQVDTCAPCHSRRTKLQDTWTVGAPFDQSFVCQAIQHPFYHRDGQIRDEDYEYGSFTQSKMFANNIRCSDCHDPHSLKVKYPDNQLCTSCHQHPAAKYDSPEHHFHQPGSAGAQCVECHMPTTTYMAVDARRDHSLRAPRPDMSVKFGTPNACTGCHLDKKKLPEDQQTKIRQYLDWIVLAEQGDEAVAEELQQTNQAMAAAFEKWYGSKPHEARTTYYHDLAELLSQSREADSGKAAELVKNFKLPAMIRSAAMLHLGSDSSAESLKIALNAIRSPDAKVASSGLPRIENELQRRLSSIDTEYVVLLSEFSILLDHAAPVVRTETARILLTVPEDVRLKSRHPDFRRRLDVVLAEWRGILATQSDRPESHMILGDIDLAQGKTSSAVNHYESSIRVAPQFAGPRTNLCQILDGNLADLRQQLSQETSLSAEAKKRIEIEIARQETRISKLRAEEHALLATELRRSEGYPGSHAIHYRFAMSCYLQSDLAGCERNLLRAHELDPQNVNYLIALIALFRDKGEIAKAINFAELLVQQDVANVEYQRLVEDLQRELNRTQK
jgi:tetratricopeptide (TPR) repeat protein